LKFTVIIPTRERPDTLYHALKTCVSQDYEDLEILVSDNYSQDNTRDVVDSFKDTRIRYINTGKRVGMSQNWEFALHHVSDGYVTVIGDDDGLLPEAVSGARFIIENTGARVLVWQKAHYYWPSYHNEAFANRLFIPLAQRIVRMRRRSALRAVENLFITPATCPQIYSGFVTSEVIKNWHGGRRAFIHSICPDIYAGFAVAAMENEWLFMTRPLGICGTSHHSIGNSFADPPPSRETEWKQFSAENGALTPHPNIRMIPGILSLALVEALLQANDHLFGGSLHINMKKLLRITFEGIAEFDESRYEESVGRAMAMAHANGLTHYATRCRRAYGRQRRKVAQANKWENENLLNTVVYQSTLEIDASRFAVANVHEATILADKFLQPLPEDFAVGEYYFPGTVVAWILNSLSRQPLYPLIAKGYFHPRTLFRLLTGT
jgi:hypothetical protein